MSISLGRPLKANFKVTSSVPKAPEGGVMDGLLGSKTGPFGPLSLQTEEKGACTPQHIALVLKIFQTPAGT